MDIVQCAYMEGLCNVQCVCVMWAYPDIVSLQSEYSCIHFCLCDVGLSRYC